MRPVSLREAAVDALCVLSSMRGVGDTETARRLAVRDLRAALKTQPEETADADD